MQTIVQIGEMVNDEWWIIKLKFLYFGLSQLIL